MGYLNQTPKRKVSKTMTLLSQSLSGVIFAEELPLSMTGYSSENIITNWLIKTPSKGDYLCPEDCMVIAIGETIMCLSSIQMIYLDIGTPSISLGSTRNQHRAKNNSWKSQTTKTFRYFSYFMNVSTLFYLLFQKQISTLMLHVLIWYELGKLLVKFI